MRPEVEPYPSGSGTGELRSQLLGCVSKQVLGSMAAVLGYPRTWMACVYQACPHTRFTVVPAPGIQGSG